MEHLSRHHQQETRKNDLKSQTDNILPKGSMTTSNTQTMSLETGSNNTGSTQSTTYEDPSKHQKTEGGLSITDIPADTTVDIKSTSVVDHPTTDSKSKLQLSTTRKDQKGTSYVDVNRETTASKQSLPIILSSAAEDRKATITSSANMSPGDIMVQTQSTKAIIENNQLITEEPTLKQYSEVPTQSETSLKPSVPTSTNTQSSSLSLYDTSSDVIDSSTTNVDISSTTNVDISTSKQTNQFDAQSTLKNRYSPTGEQQQQTNFPMSNNVETTEQHKTILTTQTESDDAATTALNGSSHKTDRTYSTRSHQTSLEPTFQQSSLPTDTDTFKISARTSIPDTGEFTKSHSSDPTEPEIVTQVNDETMTSEGAIAPLVEQTTREKSTLSTTDITVTTAVKSQERSATLSVNLEDSLYHEKTGRGIDPSGLSLIHI